MPGLAEEFEESGDGDGSPDRYNFSRFPARSGRRYPEVRIVNVDRRDTLLRTRPDT